MNKHLIYISKDNFSLYISQQLDENGFIISLYDNQLGIEYELATYIGGRYYRRCNRFISNWIVSNVKNMEHMFRYSVFNKDISKWDVSNAKSNFRLFDNSPIQYKTEYQPTFK